MPSHSWQRRLLNKLLLFGSYYSIIIGTLSCVVDYQKGRIITKRWFSVLANVSNLIFLASTPFLTQFVTTLEVTSEQSWLVLRTHHLTVCIRIVIVVFIIVFRRKRERVFLNVNEWMFKLDNRYKRSLLPSSGTPILRLDIIHLIKFTSISAQSFFAFILHLYFLEDFGLGSLLRAWYVATVLTIIHGTFFQLFTVLIRLLGRFENLNLQLESLYQSLQLAQSLGLLRLRSRICQTVQLSMLAIADLQCLAQEHYCLTALARYVPVRMQFILLGVLFWKLLQNIMFGLFIYLALESRDFKPMTSSFSIIMVSVFFVIFYLDFYLFYWCCEATTSAYHRTGQLLPLFNNLDLSDALNHQLEMFSVQLATNPLRTYASGMFSLSNASFMALTVYIHRTILILIQFEMERRLKMLRQQLDGEWTANIDDFVVEYEL